jgi:hypothetical protein
VWTGGKRAAECYRQHSSAFVRYEDLNPHCSLRQYDGVRDAAVVREALLSADVVHCHMNYMLAANALPRSRSDERTVRPVHWRAGQWIVRHYHGSRPDGRTNMEHRIDDGVRARAQTDGGGLVRVGARLTLCAEPDAGDVEWLPIAMPVARYRALRNEVGPTIARGIRIAHSPTKRLYKGTDKFMAAVASLKAKGLDVQAVLIENKDHGTALRMKAGCDAVFDSLWLGLQGSGLEGGAMGLPRATRTLPRSTRRTSARSRTRSRATRPASRTRSSAWRRTRTSTPRKRRG